MKKLLTRFAIGLIAASMAFGVAACGNDESNGRTPVTVVLDWTPNTNHSGIYLAKSEGIYEEAGLDVRIVEPDQAGAVAQVAAGNGEFAFSYAEQILPARAQGTDIVSIASVMRTNTSSLVSPADRNITRPRDLEGKTFAGYGGELERPLLDALIRCDGGDPSKLKFMDLGNVDYSVGFRRGTFDATWVFDGWDTIRLRDLNNMKVNTLAFRDYLGCIPDWYTPVIATSGSLISKDPDLVRAFLKATSDGYQKAIDDPQAAAQAIKDAAPESDMALLEPSAKFVGEYMTDANGGWGYQQPEVWKGFAEFLDTNNITSPGVDKVTEAYTNDFLPGS